VSNPPLRSHQIAELHRDTGSRMKWTPKNCKHCEYDRAETGGGWIYTGNNGPYVPCPVCNSDGAHPRH
jgi:hypothetical protein